MNNKQIPIFYACDDAFVKYTIVSLSSMMKNASKEYKYKVYVLHTDISEEMKAKTLELANERDLDLVLISPAAVPPVCKIMDYGKFCFEKEKRAKEAKKKQQVVDVKEIQLSCTIGEHDFQTKLNHAHRFLKGGDKVKVVVRFRGREMRHTELGADILAKFEKGCEGIGVAEKKAVLDGRNMTMFIAPVKQ